MNNAARENRALFKFSNYCLIDAKNITASIFKYIRASSRVFYFFLPKTCSFATPKKVLEEKKEGHLQEFSIIHS
jgi:hypothetical protein